MTNHDSPVTQAIRNRKTIKVIGQNSLHSKGLSWSTVDALIETAGWAPFHQPAHPNYREMGIDAVEPWRVYKLDADCCKNMINQIDPGENAGIIPGMLAAADALVLVTWLPDPDPEYIAPAFSPTERNMEHIAATSAFIQNLLIAATSENITTYWSSGGLFNKTNYMEKLGIPTQEILLGAVFFFPEEVGDCEVREGKLREKRSVSGAWSKWIAF